MYKVIVGIVVGLFTLVLIGRVALKKPQPTFAEKHGLGKITHTVSKRRVKDAKRSMKRLKKAKKTVQKAVKRGLTNADISKKMKIAESSVRALRGTPKKKARV